MIQQAIEYLYTLGQKLVPVQQFDINGRKYTDQSLSPLQDPLISPVEVGTLQGLVDLINAGVETLDPVQHLIHVVDHTSVKLIARTSDQWARRATVVHVKLPQTSGFNFGTFLDHESFIIGVQANFESAGDRDYVVRIASNITTEQLRTSNDDGISQQVGQKAGVALVASETLKGRVSLAPYRTFREIPQPVSEFVFRAKQDGDNRPKLALFVADGERWKIDAVEAIARRLRVDVPSIQVVA